MCGGTVQVQAAFAPGVGLSPRVRGNRCGSFPECAGRRSIPACAGEPPSPAAAAIPAAVYPRVCGGTHRRRGVAGQRGGLSPRVRGNRLQEDALLLHQRSIPACAGEPCPLCLLCWPIQVYPRVCGGTSDILFFNVLIFGLSPRVRGNPTAHCNFDPFCGSIPACAGEPGPGESSLRKIMGLSPRVRGNLSRRTRFDMMKRSIPACAGEPHFAPKSCFWTWVYPRVCGGTT